MLTFQQFGEKVGGSFGLLDSVSLHHLSVFVDAQIPRPP